MKTDTKIAIGISSIMIFIGLFLFVWILPFLFVWLSFGTELSNEESLPHLQKAVKYSVFKPQKLYTLETIIPTLLVLMCHLSVNQPHQVSDILSSRQVNQ